MEKETSERKFNGQLIETISFYYAHFLHAYFHAGINEIWETDEKTCVYNTWWYKGNNDIKTLWLFGLYRR